MHYLLAAVGAAGTHAQDNIPWWAHPVLQLIRCMLQRLGGEGGALQFAVSSIDLVQRLELRLCSPLPTSLLVKLQQK